MTNQNLASYIASFFLLSDSLTNTKCNYSTALCLSTTSSCSTWKQWKSKLWCQV